VSSVGRLPVVSLLQSRANVDLIVAHMAEGFGFLLVFTLLLFITYCRPGTSSVSMKKSSIGADTHAYYFHTPVEDY
jgi:hypothetical protein